MVWLLAIVVVAIIIYALYQGSEAQYNNIKSSALSFSDNAAHYASIVREKARNNPKLWQYYLNDSEFFHDRTPMRGNNNTVIVWDSETATYKKLK